MVQADIPHVFALCILPPSQAFIDSAFSCHLSALLPSTTFEDLTGLYDATFFPSTFQKYSHLLTGNRPYLLEGILEEEFGEVTLTVHQLALIGPNQQTRTTTPPSSAK